MITTSKQLTEEDIAAIGEKWLRATAWETYPEVVLPIFGGRPDIIATKGSLCKVIEVKKSLSYPVIEQLTRWHMDYQEARDNEWADETIKGIPHLMIALVAGFPSIGPLKRKILDDFRIGVVSITHRIEGRAAAISPTTVEYADEKWKVTEWLPPKIQQGSRHTGHKIIEHLNPDMRCASPGASGKIGGYMTPFRRTLNKALGFIAEQKKGRQVHLDHIVQHLNENGGHHYASDYSASSSLEKALEREGFAIQHRRIVAP